MPTATRTAAVCLAIPLLALAQDVNGKRKGASIAGHVLADPSGVPLKRAVVTLRPRQAGIPALAVETDEHGYFLLRDIPAGPFSLTVGRDGYIGTSTAHRAGVRLPSVISLGTLEDWTGVTFQLRPAAVLWGRVRFEDGEPAPGVAVRLYRERHFRGRHTYLAVGNARTDDRGEYRIFGLPPAAYYIAAMYDRNRGGAVDQPRFDETGRRLPDLAYTTTFYPSSPRLTDALPIRLSYGQELGGMDIFLAEAPRLTLRGSVRSGLSGQPLNGVNMLFFRVDGTGMAGVQVPVNVEFTPGGRFVARGLTPGSYRVDASATEGEARISSRRTLTLGNADIDDLDLLLRPPVSLRGQIVGDFGSGLPVGSLTVRLEPRADQGGNLAARAGDHGQLFLPIDGDEVFDIYVEGLQGDLYLRSARIGPTDVLQNGLAGTAAGGTETLTIEIASDGGSVTGRAVSRDGQAVASGATIALVPIPPAGRLASYQAGSANEAGIFEIRGVAPGNYLLFAYLDDPGCDYYDPEALRQCASQAEFITVSAASRTLAVPRLPE